VIAGSAVNERAGDPRALFSEQETTDVNTRTHINAMPDGRHADQWFRRLTAAGFAFFLAKGLFWLALAVWTVV
jgi:hypothetical protein